MKTKISIIDFIKKNISHKYVLICVIAVLSIIMLFVGTKHDPADCDKISATEMYIRIQKHMSQDIPLSTKDIKRKIVIKTGKKGYLNGNTICYATYKNIMYKKDIDFLKRLSSKWYLDPDTGKTFKLFRDDFYPQKTTTVCYMYDRTDRNYKIKTGQGRCHSAKPGIGSSGQLIKLFPKKTEEICWL